jgi:hypothetical protein
MLHHKTDGRTMRPATKTMIKLFGLANGKRWGFFVVKRTAGGVIRPGFFKRNVTLNDIYNIEAIEQILNKTFWNHSGPHDLAAEPHICQSDARVEAT